MTKTILITGSTDGIGKLAAIQIAKEGHNVYLHGRKPQKLATTISEVKTLSGNDNIDGFVADFSDMDAVRQMAGQIIDKVPKLDVLINNAGVFKSPFAINSAGFDIRIAVNYLAPYLLTSELLPLMEKQSQPRIINLSSAAQAPVSIAALQGKQRLSEQAAYAQSKLALTMWSFDLAKRCEGISVIAVNPGSLLNTKMAKEAYGQHWSSADKGANILHELALSGEYEGITGQYFDNDKGPIKGTFAKAHSDAYHPAKLVQIIETTEALVRQVKP